MHLTLLEVENFKSFGGRIRIPFLPGFTAITGPNGSGKSNIGDAILFVLGPKSAKVMRAGKLTDLIFNGGQSKKPAKFTRVSLFFDNKDRTIPVNADEVKLTRMVKLSSSNPDNYNSYFYINDRVCAQQDFDIVLQHARISGEGYNLVQQGDITRIVEMGNTDRRRILDSIAGISRFDEEISRANEKKKAADENMGRLKIITDELQQRVSQLKSESDHALRYKELKDRVQILKAQQVLKKKLGIEKEASSLQSQIESYREQIAQNRKTIDDVRAELLGMKKQLDSIDRELNLKTTNEAKALKEQVDKARLAYFKAREAVESSRDNLKRLKEEIELSIKKEQELKKQLEQYVRKKEDSAKEAEEKASELEKVEKQLQRLIENQSMKDKEIKGIQESIKKIDDELEKKKNQLHSAVLERDRRKDNFERISRDIAAVSEEIEKTEFELKDYSFELKELEKTSKNSLENLARYQKDFFEMKNLEKKILSELELLEGRRNELEGEYARAKAHSEVAQKIEKGYTKAISALMEARDRGLLKGIIGTIAELSHVSPEYELALSVAAGQRMQAIIVEDDECAEKAIEYLRKNRIGRATLLPLNKMIKGRPRGSSLMAVKDPGAVGFANELVKYKEEYEAAFWYVFGDTVVVKDIATARKYIGGTRLVTLDGTLIEASGAMIGGSHDSESIKFGVKTKGELADIGAKLNEVNTGIQSGREELKKVKEAISKAEELLRKASAEGETAQIRKNELEKRFLDLKVSLKKIKDRKEEIVSEKERIEKEYIGAVAVAEAIQNEISGLEKEKAELNRELLSLTPQDINEKITKYTSQRNQLQEKLRDLNSEVKTYGTQAEILNRNLTDTRAGIENLKASIKSLEETVQKMVEERDKNEFEMKALGKKQEMMDKENEELRRKREDCLKNMLELEKKEDSLLTQVNTWEELILTFNYKLSGINERLQETVREYEALGVKYDGPLLSQEKLNEQMEQATKEMAALEPVNMLAIEEYEKQSGRLKEILEETDRLTQERDELLKFIEELNGKKKCALLKVFNVVNENFS
ncbi:MAG: ATP-binding protein, partial [Thermoplasmata archaeon]